MIAAKGLRRCLYRRDTRKHRAILRWARNREMALLHAAQRARLRRFTIFRNNLVFGHHYFLGEVARPACHRRHTA